MVYRDGGAMDLPQEQTMHVVYVVLLRHPPVTPAPRIKSLRKEPWILNVFQLLQERTEDIVQPNQ